MGEVAARQAGKYAWPLFALESVRRATIGAGIFLAASQQANAALRAAPPHKFQHSIFEPFRHFTGDILVFESGVRFALPGLVCQ